MPLNSKSIARNTFWLYVRMIFILLVGLYTSRVILRTLGVTDYGIYDVVGGVVALLGFLKNSLSGATSRFLAFELGRCDYQRLKKTFEASLTVHAALSIIVVIILETAGYWFVGNKLEIPPERLDSALIVFHFSVCASVINIMQVPFNACVIARERMDFFALIGIIDAILKLSIAYLITISVFDKLSFYGFLVSVEAFVILLGYIIYCKHEFPECSLSIKIETKVIKPILNFSFWDLYGNLSVVVRSQGLSILQNVFFGPIVNASTAISNQVMSGIMGFADNFLTAIKPQVFKQYAQQNIKSFLGLINTSSKLSFALLLLVSAPLIAETNYVMNIWLVEVPMWAVVFCQLSIVNNWVSIIFRPIVFAIHATGYAKRISLINGTIYIMVLPLSYVFLRFGASPVVPFIINIALLIIGHVFFSLSTLRKYVPQFSVSAFIARIVLPSLCLAILSLIPSYFIKWFMDESFIRFIINSFSTVFFVVLCCWLVMFDSEEKIFVKAFINKKLNRKKMNS